METFYHSEPRIQEWVEQVIEKIFTTCLLSGNDSDQEYQKGCQLIAKLTELLLGFNTFPSEYLADGIIQIIEQQLPDSRVINNFPTFNGTMNKMLQEGMSKVINIQNNEDSNEDVQLSPPLLEVEVASLAENPGQVSQEESIACIAPVTSERTSAVHNKFERLDEVLSRIFPKSTVVWNATILNHDFLAQVEDLLICLYDPASLCEIDKYQKDGWRILVLREDDLAYPRRLEREIKTIKRRGKCL